MRTTSPNTQSLSTFDVSNDTIAPSQEEHADALGVRGSGSHKRFEEGVSNDTATPSQEERADALGVHRASSITETSWILGGNDKKRFIIYQRHRK